MSTLIGESIIQSKIDHSEFITMHKSELKSLVFDADTLNWMAEFSDKIGAAFLGVWLTLLGLANYSKLEIYGTFFCGSFLTISGIYYKCQRNKKINTIIDKKIKESEQIKEQPVSEPD